jgi:hypothetical protein
MDHAYTSLLPLYETRNRLRNVREELAEQKAYKRLGLRFLRPHAVVHRLVKISEIEKLSKDELTKRAGKIGLQTMLKTFKYTVNNRPGQLLKLRTAGLRLNQDATRLVLGLEPSDELVELQAFVDKTYKTGLSEYGVRALSLDEVAARTSEIPEYPELILLGADQGMPETIIPAAEKMLVANLVFHQLVTKLPPLPRN